MQQPILKGLIAKTIFAASKDENRHTLTGLCLEIKDKRLTFAATDGRRLAVVSHDIDAGIDNLKCILPAKSMRYLMQILRPEGEVKIYPGKNLVCFEASNTILGVRLIEGEFPEYQQIIPKETKIEFNLEVEKLISATKRAAIFTKEGSGVKYSFGDNRLIFTSNTPEIGEAKEEVEIESSEKIDIAFSPQYFLDALQSINTKRVILGLNDSSSAAVIGPLNDGNCLQLLMPMQME